MAALYLHNALFAAEGGAETSYTPIDEGDRRHTHEPEPSTAGAEAGGSVGHGQSVGHGGSVGHGTSLGHGRTASTSSFTPTHERSNTTISDSKTYSEGEGLLDELGRLQYADGSAVRPTSYADGSTPTSPSSSYGQPLTASLGSGSLTTSYGTPISRSSMGASSFGQAIHSSLSSSSYGQPINNSSLSSSSYGQPMPRPGSISSSSYGTALPSQPSWDSNFAHATTYLNSHGPLTASSRDPSSLDRHRMTQTIRRRLRVRRAYQRVGEVVVGAWSVYTTVRYLIAYINGGPTPALILGTLSASSFLFLSFEVILSLPQFRLLFLPHVGLILKTKWVLRSLVVGLLIGVAVADVSESDSAGSRSCRELSTLWSSSSCTALKVIRIVVTAVVCALYLGGAYAYQRVRHPATSSCGPFGYGRKKSGLSVTTVTTADSGTGTGMGRAQGEKGVEMRRVTPQSSDRLQRPSLVSASMSSLGSLKNSISGSLSSVSTTKRLPSLPSLPYTPPQSSEELPSGSTSPSGARSKSPSRGPGRPNATQPNDADLHTFVDRFRSLVAQISRETDDAVGYAVEDDSNPTPGTTSNPTPSKLGHSRNPFFAMEHDPSHTASGSNTNNPYAHPSHSPYYDPYAHTPTDDTGLAGAAAFDPSIMAGVGYDEFGRPYPPDEHLAFLGGFVKRMPTIESIGSREMSTLGSAGLSRSNTMSTTGRLHSRGNSLYLPGDIAAYVAGEVGVGSVSPTALTFGAGDGKTSPGPNGVDELGVRTNPQHGASGTGSGSGTGSSGTGATASSWYTAGDGTGA